jgi:hypothetical protein
MRNRTEFFATSPLRYELPNPDINIPNTTTNVYCTIPAEFPQPRARGRNLRQFRFQVKDQNKPQLK